MTDGTRPRRNPRATPITRGERGTETRLAIRHARRAHKKPNQFGRGRRVRIVHIPVRNAHV